MKNGKDPDSYLPSPVPFPDLTWTRAEGPEPSIPAAAASPPRCPGRAPAGTPFPRALCPPPNLEQVGKAWLSSSHAPAPGWAAAEGPAGAAQGGLGVRESPPWWVGTSSLDSGVLRRQLLTLVGRPAARRVLVACRRWPGNARCGGYLHSRALSPLEAVVLPLTTPGARCPLGALSLPLWLESRPAS